MGYTGANITDCSSPTIGNDKATYTALFDAAMQAIDEHDHSTTKGLQIPTGGLADLAVTTAKLDNTAVTAAKIAASVAGNGLTGGAGTPLAVVVDTTTIEISADTVRIAASAAGLGLTGGGGSPLAVNPDNSTIEVNVDQVRVKDAGITRPKIAPLGEQVSSGSGNFVRASSGEDAVAGTSVTITTTGRPVMLFLMATSGAGFISVRDDNTDNEAAGTFTIKRGGSLTIFSGAFRTSTQANGVTRIPPGCIMGIDTSASAATHTYQLYAGPDGTSSVEIDSVKLVAFEIG